MQSPQPCCNEAIHLLHFTFVWAYKNVHCVERRLLYNLLLIIIEGDAIVYPSTIVSYALQ